MSNLLRRIEALQDKIDKAKEAKARCEGELASLMRRLKELGCDSVEEAEKLARRLEGREAALKKELQDSVQKCEELMQKMEAGR